MDGVRYKIDLHASYAIVEIPEKVNRKQYTFQMLQRNQMRGILPVRERVENGEACLYLDITGKKNLWQEYTEKEMELEEMILLFQQMMEILEELRNYLLPESMAVLEPEFMYRGLEDGELYLTLLPWEREERISLHKFAEFLLEKINHRDEHGVNAAYQFYKQQKEPQFSLRTFLPVMEKESILKRQKNREREETNGERVSAAIKEPIWERADFDVEAEASEALFLEEESKEKKESWLTRFLGKGTARKSKEKKKKEKRRKKPPEPEKFFSEEPSGVSVSAFEETVFFQPQQENESRKLQWRERGRIREYVLKSFPVTLGKLKEEADLVIADASVSRLHCRFVENKDGIGLMDMNSTNGTCVNGMRLQQGEIMEIEKNDEIQIGKVKILVV